MNNLKIENITMNCKPVSDNYCGVCVKKENKGTLENQLLVELKEIVSKIENNKLDIRNVNKYTNLYDENGIIFNELSIIFRYKV